LKLTSLSRLSIERTAVNDTGIAMLTSLPNLTYLNLVGTTVTVNGLMQLKSLKELRQIFLYQTSISGQEFSQLNKIFPKAVIDTGGYKLKYLESDTVELKSARVKL
jgi:hypothetical protein